MRVKVAGISTDVNGSHAFQAQENTSHSCSGIMSLEPFQTNAETTRFVPKTQKLVLTLSSQIDISLN